MTLADVATLGDVKFMSDELKTSARQLMLVSFALVIFSNLLTF